MFATCCMHWIESCQPPFLDQVIDKFISSDFLLHIICRLIGLVGRESLLTLLIRVRWSPVWTKLFCECVTVAVAHACSGRRFRLDRQCQWMVEVGTFGFRGRTIGFLFFSGIKSIEQRDDLKLRSVGPRCLESCWWAVLLMKQIQTQILRCGSKTIREEGSTQLAIGWWQECTFDRRIRAPMIKISRGQTKLAEMSGEIRIYEGIDGVPGECKQFDQSRSG